MAGSYGQGTTTGYARLEVSGTDLMKHKVVPTDIEPIRWRDEAGAVGELTFCVEDTPGNRHDIPGGGLVNLWVDGTRVFGYGTLIRRRFERGRAGQRLIRCTALSADAWLDWRIVPRWASLIDLGNRVRQMTTDRQMVKDVIERRGGPIQATNATVQLTNSDMDVVRMAGELTLRDVLDRIADEAREDGGAARRYHVDDQMRLHWYQFPEGPEAPYRISDGLYVRDVIDSSPTYFWTLQEESGTTAYGTGANLTLNGTWTKGTWPTSFGVVNERSHRPAIFDGSTTYASGTVTTPGNTFTVALWFRRGAFSAVQNVVHANATNDFRVDFDASNSIRLFKHGVATSFTSTPTYTDTSWHHLVIAHDATSTLVYVDGSSISGSGTNQTFTGGSRTLSIGASSAGADKFTGRLSHIAIYSSKMSAATALAHYRQGRSVAAEGLWIEDDWGDVVESVYVRGKNAAGSGWVSEGGPFEVGRVQAFLTREHADTTRERNRAGRSFLRRNRYIRSGGFATREAGAWAAGQVIYVTDSAIGLSNEGMLVAGVSGELADTGLSYEIELGAVRRRLLRQMRRRRR